MKASDVHASRLSHSGLFRASESEETDRARWKDQVAVLELRKDIVRTTLSIVETRSGKKVTFQDDEARKSGK